MKHVPFVAIIMIALAPLLVGCDDDDDPAGPEPTYDLTFTGDATFQGAHGGQNIAVAVVEQATGEVVAEDSGTVSADADPSFSFTFADALEQGASYYVDFWIDSNFAGGQAGSCDDPEIDHQWRLTVGAVNDDVTLDDTHRPGDIQSVCSTFE